MKIKLYGTAAAEGIPALFCECEVCMHAQIVKGKEIRSRSQSLINDDLLIDFSSDTFMHKIYNGLKLEDIEHCLITHSHHDHFFPQDLMMRMVGYSGNIENKLTVYGNDTVKKNFDQAQSLEGYDDLSRLEFKEIKAFEPFKVLDYTVTALLADHDPKETCFIYTISQNNHNILYAHDTGPLPQSVWDYFEKTLPHFDAVILDSTHGFVEVESNHMNFKHNLFTKEKLKDYTDDKTQFVITHFSHHALLTHKEIDAWAKENGFVAAYDGIEIHI